MKKILLSVLLGALVMLSAQVQAQVKDFGIIVITKDSTVKGKNKTSIVFSKSPNVMLVNSKKTASFGIDLGIDLGWNRFITTNVSSNDAEIVKDLTLEKGPNFTLNIFKGYVDLFDNHSIRLQTAVGFDYNSYHFSNPITLEKNAATLTYTNGKVGAFKKNLLRATYLRIPIAIVLRDPKNGLGISAGYEIGLLLGGKTKQIDADGRKIKSKSDYNLNAFRQGIFLRVGKDSFNVYGKYYLSDVFAKNQGPKGMNSFSVGVSFGGF